MALTKCADCGKEVSDRAKVCPNCGCPIECSVTESLDLHQGENTLSSVNTAPTAENTEITMQHEDSSQTTDTQTNKIQNLLQKTKNLFILKDGEKFNKKKLIILSSFLGGILLVITIIAIVSGNSSSDLYYDDYNDYGSYYYDTFEDNSYNDDSYNDSNNDYTPSIQYISDRSVDYDQTNQYHRVFFGLKDSYENYMSANNGTATIKIENSAGEIVYSKDIPFTKSDFSTWTNNYWDSSRLLACLYIKDSELTEGSSDNGKLSLSVVADGANFSATILSINDLPTKSLSINLPTVPQTFSDYGYSNNLEATIRVDKLTYTSTVYDYDDVTVTFSFQTTMTYNSTPGKSKYVYIGYKLKNSSGIIVDSGTVGISQSDTGDTSLTNQIIFDLNMKETYTLELSNSTN